MKTDKQSESIEEIRRKCQMSSSLNVPWSSGESLTKGLRKEGAPCCLNELSLEAFDSFK
jgi:hypothetical protein